METMPLNQMIQFLPQYFQPERAAGVEVIIQVNFTGDKGGNWTVAIKDQTCTVEEGYSPTPTLTVEADAQDIYEIIDGSLDPMSAFMTGRIALKGDRSKAMKLITLFKVDSLPF